MRGTQESRIWRQLQFLSGCWKISFQKYTWTVKKYCNIIKLICFYFSWCYIEMHSGPYACLVSTLHSHPAFFFNLWTLFPCCFCKHHSSREWWSLQSRRGGCDPAVCFLLFKEESLNLVGKLTWKFNLIGFYCCDKKDIKKERYSLAHSSRGFIPWLHSF